MQGDIRPLRQTNRTHAVVRPALRPVERHTIRKLESKTALGRTTSIDFIQPKPGSGPVAKIISHPVVASTSVKIVSPMAKKPDLELDAKPVTRSDVQAFHKSIVSSTAENSKSSVLHTATKKGDSLEITSKSLGNEKTDKSFFKRILAGHRIVYGAAVVVFVAGAGIAMQGLFVNQEVQSQVQVLSSNSGNPTGLTQTADEVPSEEKPHPDAVDSYKVAADLPRTISLPSLGVKARVLQVGVDSDNQSLAPKNVFDVAWYTGSSKPGEAGAAVIDGHYSGISTKGVFGYIKNLKNGDKIDVERGDGGVISFTVRQIETVASDAVDMGKLLVSVETNLPGLNLITCGGKFDSTTHKFSDRTVVYAVLE